MKDEALKMALEFFETMQRYKGTRSNIFIKFEPTATGDYLNLQEFDGRAKPIIAVIKQALAQPVQEPLFWYRPCSNGMYEGPIHNAQIEEVRQQSGAWVPLVTATTPPAQEFVCSTGLCHYRKPLTDDEIAAIVRKAARGAAIRRDGSTSERIARAIEAAHGIKENT